MYDIDSAMKKLMAWQYLNVATFLMVAVILILLLI